MFSILNSCKVQEKNGILIEPTLLPDKEYRTVLITEDNSTIEYKNNANILKALEDKGVEYPITSNKKSIMESTLITGKSNGEKYSLSSSYDKAQSEHTGSLTKLQEPQKTIDNLEGAKVFGWIKNQRDIVIDSIVGLKDESLRTTIEQGMKNILNQIEYPKEKLEVGNSFSIETPMKFPAENGIVLDMVLMNTYKLDSINNSVAYLSIIQEMEARTEIAETDMKLEGLGSGRIEYHLTDKTYQLYKTEMNINTSTAVQDFEVITKARTISTMKTEIIRK